MGIHGQLGGVEHELMKDLRETIIPTSQLAREYGVSRQGIYDFIGRRGVKRPKREHTKKCPICRGLLRIARKPHSDFISSQTVREELGLGRVRIRYHLRILRSKGLVSQQFGRVRSKKVERGYQIYFTKRLPVYTIGKLVGLKNFYSTIKRHKALGWDVPASLFIYDSHERSKNHLRGARR